MPGRFSMRKIFVSYRRQDTAGTAGRIYDRLCAHFGEDDLFIDMDSIPFGVDFREQIVRAVDQCGVMLAVIGPKWLGETETGRRIDDPRDFVRIELEVALQRKLPVIPVLIDRTPMPAESELPPLLHALAYRNAIDIDQWRDFHHHVDRLIKGIEYHRELNVRVPSSTPSESPMPLAPSPDPNSAAVRKQKSAKRTPASAPAWRPGSPADPARAQAKAALGEGQPAELRQAEPLLKPLLPASRRKRPAAASQPWSALRRWNDTPRHWRYLAALPVLALIGVVTYIASGPKTDSGTAPGPHLTSAHEKTQSASPRTRAEPPAPPAGPNLKPGRSEKEWKNTVGITLIRIDPGEFQMGSPKLGKWDDPEDEEQQHSVRISRAFYLGVHEVTQGQYRAVMHESPSNFNGSDDLPVENVSWLEAVAFCNKLSAREQRTPCYQFERNEVKLVAGTGYRLPTEAEWEYACRSGSTTVYPFGDDKDRLGECSWFVENAERVTHPVGEKRPNAWGLHDMLGNVWEWTGDWYDERYYASSAVWAPADPPGPHRTSARVYRGGSWRDQPGICRSAYRCSDWPQYRSSNLGFRVAAVQEQAGQGAIGGRLSDLVANLTSVIPTSREVRRHAL
jgi:formylglycine-generating enzyme required for sulfatase activity